MKIEVVTPKKKFEADVIVLPAFTKKITKGSKEEKSLVLNHWPSDVKESFQKIKKKDHFKGNKGERIAFYLEDGTGVLVVGLGDKTKISQEDLRRETSKVIKENLLNYKNPAFCLDSFHVVKDKLKTATILTEALTLTSYNFDKYLSKKNENKFDTVYFLLNKAQSTKTIEKAITEAQNVSESVNVARDYVNEPPNTLFAVSYAKMIEDDVKKNLKGSGTKVKILGKPELKKEKWDFFFQLIRVQSMIQGLFI